MKEKEEEFNQFDDDLLNEKKKMYRKYHIRETLDSKKWIFIDKENDDKPVNVLTFVRLPDVFFDKLQQKEVSKKSSALVRLIMDKIYQRTEISLSGWKGRKKCKIPKKGCRKCLAKQVAIPKTGKVLLKYNFDYVYDHLNEFEIMVKCKLFDLDNKEKFVYKYIPITQIKQYGLASRNLWIQQILEADIPSWVVEKWFGLSRRQVCYIKKLGR